MIERTTSRDLRPTQQCHFEWFWVTKRNIQLHEASRGLSATAELLVLSVVIELKDLH